MATASSEPSAIAIRRTTFMAFPLSSNGPSGAVPPFDLDPPPIWGSPMPNIPVGRGTRKDANAATTHAVGPVYDACCKRGLRACALLLERQDCAPCRQTPPLLASEG